jgi:hypothetical protein
MSNNTNRSDKAVSINDNLKMSVSLLKDIRGLVREVSGLSDIKKARSLAVAAAPVAEVKPAEVAPVAEVAEKRDVEQEAVSLASAITALGSAITALMRDAATTASAVAEAAGLNAQDLRDLTLRRQAMVERAGALLAGEVAAVWQEVKPVVLEGAKASVEVALAAAKAEAAHDAELDALHHAKRVTQLKREQEQEQEQAEHERELLRLKRKLELKALKAELDA